MSVTQSLILVSKLMNTLASQSFLADIQKPWSGADNNQNITAIQEKAAFNLDKHIEAMSKPGVKEEVLAYLDEFNRVHEAGVNKAGTNGLITSLSFEHAKQAKRFVYDHSDGFRPGRELQSGQNKFHDLLDGVVTWFVVKDSVENGTGIAGLDRIIKDLLETKSFEFFRDGFIADLFYSDRLEFEGGSDRKGLRIDLKRLSTMPVDGEDSDPNYSKYFEFRKVA